MRTASARFLDYNWSVLFLSFRPRRRGKKVCFTRSLVVLTHACVWRLPHGSPAHTHIHRQTKLVTKWISLTVLFAAASQSRSRGMMKQKHTTGLIDAFEINTNEIKDIKMLRDFCGDETDPPSDHQILLLPAKPNTTKTVLISGVWKMHIYTLIVYDSMKSYYFSG